MYTIDEIAALVDRYSEDYSLLLKVCSWLELSLVNSALFNFRDAIAHYRIYYEADRNGDRDTMIRQETSIVEHLHRGLRDGCCFILQNLKKGLFCEMNDNKYPDDMRRKLRKLLHKCKSFELDLRKQSMITDTEITRCFNNLSPLAGDILELFAKNSLGHNFSKYSSKPDA